MTQANTAPPQITPADLRGAMGRFATGVTVITGRDTDGAPVGTTVSAVTSLSLEPPLVLVCLDRKSQTLAAVREHGAFAVNVLGAHHQEVSNAFARSANHAAWDDLTHSEGVTGSPLLDDAHIALDCRLDRLSDGGDHEILIGRVVGLHHPEDDGEPLLYYGGKYHGLAGSGEAAARAARAAREAREAREAKEAAERDAVESALPTRDGQFRILAHERHEGDLTAALVHGDPATHPSPVVRAHEACLLGDVFGSLACTCGEELRASQEAILQAGAGVLLYTKRDSADTFLCVASPGPDAAVGAGLLARLGVSAATATAPLHAVRAAGPGTSPASPSAGAPAPAPTTADASARRAA